MCHGDADCFIFSQREFIMKSAIYCTMILSLALVACDSTTGTDVQDGPDFVVGKEATGTSVSCHVDAEFEVELPCNPSTGYSWSLVEIDTLVVQQTGECVHTPDPDRPKGGEGMCAFTFGTIGRGETTIRMLYARSLDADAAVDSFQLRVMVE